jgi:hypothetical protein
MTPSVEEVAKIIETSQDSLYKYITTHETETMELETREILHYGNTLYHYTTAEGLKGILESGSIWATNSNYLNDSTELLYGNRKTLEFLTTKRLESDSPLLASFLDSALKALKEDVPMGETYLACFCRHGDLLSQWRGYGARGLGYSIRLRPLAMRYNARPDRIYALNKVTYDDYFLKVEIRKTYDEVVKALNETIELFPKEAIEFIGNPTPEHAHKIGPDSLNDAESYSRLWESAKSKLVSLTYFAFCSMFHRFKDNGFHEEDEWRIIHCDAGMMGSPAVSYRTANGIIVPYVELPLFRDSAGNPGGFEITGIKCGPSPHPENTKRSVEMLLASLKREPNSRLGDIEVENSVIPYRSW